MTGQAIVVFDNPEEAETIEKVYGAYVDYERKAFKVEPPSYESWLAMMAVYGAWKAGWLVPFEPSVS